MGVLFCKKTTINAGTIAFIVYFGFGYLIRSVAILINAIKH